MSSVLGWMIYVIAVLQLPGWALFATARLSPKTIDSWWGSLKKSFRPLPEWGPEQVPTRLRYQEEVEQYDATVPRDRNVTDLIKRKLLS